MDTNNQPDDELDEILSAHGNSNYQAGKKYGHQSDNVRREAKTEAKHRLNALIDKKVREAETKGIAKINQRFSGLWGIGGDGNDHVTTYRNVYWKNSQEISQLQNNQPKKGDI